MAGQVGRRIVDMVWEDLRPRKILTPAAFHNAITVDMALGGSTNAIIHLVAMAGRAGLTLPLEDFDALSRTTPWLANIRPSGNYLMEDFYYAGGIRALMRALGDRLHGMCMTVNGRTLGENLEGAEIWKGHEEVIRTAGTALSPEGGTVILRGNLAPDGAVFKQSAAEPHLLSHSGPAIVFKDYNDMAARIDDPDLDVTKDSVLVLQSAGPLGGPGMPEWGQLPIPKKLLQQGVRDMVRISDARMSGTSYGACVLHVAPESHVGGPLALVRTGDVITLDVPNRRLTLEVGDAELAARRAQWVPPKAKFPRGYGAMYSAHVTQADRGCDFDFLHETEEAVAEPEIH
jgi:dihydroxy-acid dehydratase